MRGTLQTLAKIELKVISIETKLIAIEEKQSQSKIMIY